MSEMRNYQSRMGDANSRRFETFSYLPEMDAAKLRRQVKYMIDNWYMWKLPLFGERDVNAVMNELSACRTANPGDHVRLVGYDNKRQSQGLSMVVFRGAA